MPYSVMKLDNQTQTGGSGNSNALRWLKTPVDGSLVIVLLSVILGISLRVCHLRSFNEDSFVGPDSARIIRQAKVIAENGSLLERDEMRAAPLGRSNHHQLTFYPHLIVQIYRALHLFGVPLSLEQVAVLSPVIFFALACLAFYALVKESLGQPVALLSVNFAAVLPILTNRTMAGYVDRDGLCLFLGLLSYLFYFRAYHSKYLKRRLLLAAASGLTMGMLGLTWQGVAIFSLVIVIVEIVRLITHQHNRGDFYIYLCWATPFLLALLSVKQTYHDLSQSFAFLAVIPPGVLIVLVIGHLVNSLISSNRLKLALLLAGVVITGIVAIRISPWQMLPSLWENINVPFGRSRLMETIGELRKKGLIDWFFWPGIFFLPIAGGLFGTAVRWIRSLLNIPLDNSTTFPGYCPWYDI